MDLIVKGKVIDTPMDVMLKTLQSELNNGLLADIGEENNKNIPVTCPIHKDGKERHPSCNVFCDRNDENIVYGLVHCFTCGYSATFPKFVGDCFGADENFGAEWLSERFGTLSEDKELYLPEIELNKNTRNKEIDFNILNKYNYYHPYMWKRKLSKEVVDLFNVGFDSDTNCITFPVWDENNRLVMITKRNVKSKYFYIDKDVEKPVYLLNYINNKNIDSVIVCESQINALTCWSWGYPAIALFGTGSSYQYDILNKSGIRNYLLCFDGDLAGDNGRKRFLKNIRNDVMVSWKEIPKGKDVNDITKEEFDNLKIFF